MVLQRYTHDGLDMEHSDTGEYVRFSEVTARDKAQAAEWRKEAIEQRSRGHALRKEGDRDAFNVCEGAAYVYLGCADAIDPEGAK